MRLDEVSKRADSLVNSFPVPNAPSSFGKPYTFPEDVMSITTQELGKWLFKLAGWKGYALRLLAAEEYQYVTISKVFETKMEMKMAEVKSEKKMVKEALHGYILNENEDLKVLKKKCIEKEAYLISLKRLVELYSMQLDIISRDISRRALDIKLFQKGIQSLDD